MKKIAVVVLLGFTMLASTTHASSVLWGAFTSNGVALANGTPLAAGNLVLVGSFSTLSNAQVAADMSAGNVSAVLTDFKQFDSSTIGTGVGGLAGYWNKNSTVSANALSLQNKEIFYFVFNATTTAASQYGIFTNPSLPTWIFPDDGAIPNTTSTELNQVPTNSTGILWGSFNPSGLSGLGAFQLAELAAIPEPSTLALIGFALVGAPAVYLRRRKQK